MEYHGIVNNKAENGGETMENIKNAIYVSVWDNGTALESPCKVNENTKEIFDIQLAANNDVDILEKEYVVIEGQKNNACHEDDYTGSGYFWR